MSETTSPLMRAKLTVTTVTKSRYPGENVKFTADYSGSKEDNSFSEATPSAELEMFVSNPNLIGKLVPGQSFYVDFIPVDPPATE